MGISNTTITIVDANGNATVIPVAGAVSTSGVMVMGSDGTNARFLSTDTTGRLVVIGQGVAGTPAGGIVSIQGVTGGTALQTDDAASSATGAAVPAQALYIGASDGTNLQGLRIKPASTAAIATDPALVVAISPNNPISVSGTADTTATGALGALNAAVQVNTAGLETAGFQLAAGTLIGTIVSEASFDGGTTWVASYFDTPTSGKVSSIVFASANGATAATLIGVGGSGLSRVRVSAWTSGTANITVRGTTRSDPSVLFAGPLGAAVPPSAAYIGGTDGTNLIALRMKAASTAATAADPSLVVALSPNSPTPNPISVFDFSNANLANAATYTTQSFDSLTNGCGITFSVFSDQILTYFLDVSTDNATWRIEDSGTTIAPSTTYQETHYASARYFRMRFTNNSGVTTTVMWLSTTQRPYQPDESIRLTDRTGGDAVIKAASTAAVAGDQALVVALSPNSHVTGNVKPLYGTANQAITITLASLGSSATAARASTAVDNTTNLFEDALLFVKLTTAAASTSATGYANIYVYATVDNGTTYSENATGTDAALTIVAPTNLILVAQVNLVANAVTYRAGPFSICRMAGWDRLPQKWGVVVTNVSGAALNATAGNHAITWQGVNGQFI